MKLMTELMSYLWKEKVFTAMIIYIGVSDAHPSSGDVTKYIDVTNDKGLLV